jgi:membrane peptidoglycan carboxypeptidase
VAGKTGTTDDNKSAWFVGYTPQLSTAISMFRYDDNEKHTNREFEKMYGTGGEETIHGASFPAQIWHDYMADALRGADVLTFPKPEPWGETLYGGGAPSPSPTPSIAPSETPSRTPSTTPSMTPSSPTPDPSGSCGAWDLNCQNSNGGNNGGNSAGSGGGGSPNPTDGTTSPDTSSVGGGNGNGNGNGNGGLFGGPTG